MAAKLVGMTVALGLSACVTTQQDLIYLNDQIVAMNSRVNTLEDRFGKKLAGDVDARLSAVVQSQTDIRTEIDRLRKNLQETSARLEDNERLVRHFGERDTTREDQSKTRLTDLIDRVAALEIAVKQLQDQAGLKSPAELGPQVIAQPPVKPAEPAKPLPTPPEKPAVSPQQSSYDAALSAYKDGKYDQAVTEFRDFLRRYPDSPLRDNAQYWIGESYMGLKQHEQAILAYQEVIKKYPEGNKVPGAMLKQALAFQEIKDQTSAKLLLQKVIKSYPNSTEAKLAQAHLKKME